MEIDKNGRTEQEFLAAYDRTKYDRPSFTADNLLFADNGDGLVVLMVKRGGHPFWASGRCRADS